MKRECLIASVFVSYFVAVEVRSALHGAENERAPACEPTRALLRKRVELSFMMCTVHVCVHLKMPPPPDIANRSLGISHLISSPTEKKKKKAFPACGDRIASKKRLKCRPWLQL